MARGKHTAPKSGTGRAGWGLLGMVFGLILAMSAPVMATHATDPTPSTNEINKTNGWAHFNVVEVRRGEVDIQFVSTRGFASCFEYRSDGEAPNSSENPNTEIHDGLWTFDCVTNSTAERTIAAESHVEIRMVFGAEKDERFNWTRVDVLAALAKDDCKSGGFETEGFSNQGRCVASTQANERAGLGPDALPRGRP